MYFEPLHLVSRVTSGMELQTTKQAMRAPLLDSKDDQVLQGPLLTTVPGSGPSGLQHQTRTLRTSNILKYKVGVRSDQRGGYTGQQGWFVHELVPDNGIDGPGTVVVGSTDPTAAAEPVHMELQTSPEFDADGAPVNELAMKQVGQEWRRPGHAGASPRVIRLAFRALEGATDGFSKFNEIGRGASCTVFTARVFGVTVAVKRLKEGSAEWEAKQFVAEMEFLCAVSHPSILALLAFSTDGPQRCLVLELCTGGALNERLACRAADGQQADPLQWQQRVQIAGDVAGALQHLHSLTPQMIHRDLKAANVLLDGVSGKAKVADFGTVREGVVQGPDGGTTLTHLVTGQVIGTPSYMAPVRSGCVWCRALLLALRGRGLVA